MGGGVCWLARSISIGHHGTNKALASPSTAKARAKPFKIAQRRCSCRPKEEQEHKHYRQLGLGRQTGESGPGCEIAASLEQLPCERDQEKNEDQGLADEQRRSPRR